ncbi:CoA-binding protein [Serratia nevei]|uniref:CoA-binding protein n=1 Tax=Serratia nevei TaxID=2703794 RepID=UPI004067C7BD
MQDQEIIELLQQVKTIALVGASDNPSRPSYGVMAYLLAQEAIAIGARALWLQIGVINEQAAELAQQAGLRVVMDRCPKIDIPRLGLER